MLQIYEIVLTLPNKNEKVYEEYQPVDKSGDAGIFYVKIFTVTCPIFLDKSSDEKEVKVIRFDEEVPF